MVQPTEYRFSTYRAKVVESMPGLRQRQDLILGRVWNAWVNAMCAPQEPETGAVPANQRFRPHDNQGGAQRLFASACSGSSVVEMKRVSDIEERISSIPAIDENLSHSSSS